MQFTAALWDLMWDLLVLFSSGRSHTAKADTYTQIRVTDSPQDRSHDNTLNPTRQCCCPEKFTVTKVTCQQEASFPALLRPLQAVPSPFREDEGNSHNMRNAKIRNGLY